MWMKKMLSEGNQIHNVISSSGSGTVINYGSGSDFLTSYGSGSSSTSQKVTVPTVPVPQRWILRIRMILTAPVLRHSAHTRCLRQCCKPSLFFTVPFLPTNDNLRSRLRIWTTKSSWKIFFEKILRFYILSFFTRNKINKFNQIYRKMWMKKC
jgi:hypothetical protein